MESINDLYVFATRYGVNMKDALSESGLGSNWAHRQKKGKRTDPVKLARLRDTLIRTAKESGAYKPGSVADEVAGIREALDRIESAAGVE